MSVLNYTKNKANHIYIPISSHFLTNPGKQIKYELFDSRRIHLSDQGIDIVIRGVKQYLSNKQVIQKVLAQIPRWVRLFRQFLAPLGLAGWPRALPWGQSSIFSQRLQYLELEDNQFII